MELDITNEDLKNIASAIKAGGKIWENTLLEGFKRKIKDYNRHLQSQQCCYCRRSMADEFNMVIDIEHVLPKNQFLEFMFETFNLSVSCKRCNMEIKNENIDFLVDHSEVIKDPKNSKQYKLIHPNIDRYFDHIEYLAKTVNDKSVVKYRILSNSEKGQFTYDYFLLSEIEKQSYNQAQGIKPEQKLSEKIPAESAKKIRELLKKSKA